jgi:hypothetical protein
MGFAALYPSYTLRELRQQPLPRHVIELEPDAIGILEQDRIVSRRPLILARDADDLCAERLEEAVQFVDVGAFPRAETQVDAGRRASARTPRLRARLTAR